jgi:hypothetical protein
VTAFITSLVGLLLAVGAVMAYGKRRPVGTPLTWGESMIAAVVVFGLFFLAYGVVPHSLLAWADGPLKWRSDAIGIPGGPLHKVLKNFENHWYSAKTNSIFPQGVTFFGRGRVIVTKQAVRDALTAGIYIVFLGGQIAVWSMWQKRGKKAAAAKAIEPSSAFGRPLLKKA